MVIFNIYVKLPEGNHQVMLMFGGWQNGANESNESNETDLKPPARCKYAGISPLPLLSQ